MKKCAVIHQPGSVVALFDVYSDPGDLLVEAAGHARRRGVNLEAVAIVSPLRAWFITIGRSMAPVPLPPPSSREAEEEAVVRTVTHRVAAVPRDVPVRWRVFHGTRRAALREAGGGMSFVDTTEVDALVMPVQA